MIARLLLMVATLAVVACSSSGAITVDGDATPPPQEADPLAITAPDDGTTVADDTIVVEGTAPSGSEVTLDVRLGRDVHSVVTGGRWTMRVKLEEGDNLLVFRLGRDATTSATLFVISAPSGGGPTETDTASPEPEPIAEATPEPDPTAEPEPADLSVRVTKRTSSVARNSTASVTIKTVKGSTCSILVEYVIRVAIVDDHPVYREGTAALLAQEPDLRISALGGTTDDALRIVSGSDPPDVLLLDVRLGDESGLRILDALDGRTAVIVVTAYDYPEYVRAALAGGAAGFVAKGASTAELVAAVHRAAAGELAFTRRPDGGGPPLTTREAEVVRLVVDGLSNDEAGQRLGITTKAVEGHLGRVFARTGIRSRTELAVRAVREGWTELP